MDTDAEMEAAKDHHDAMLATGYVLVQYGPDDWGYEPGPEMIEDDTRGMTVDISPDPDAPF